MPKEWNEIELAIQTGWTLEYIRSLSMQDYNNVLQILDAKIKAGVR